MMVIGVLATLTLAGAVGADGGRDVWSVLWTGAPSSPSLTFRGATMTLPLYGGIPLYEDAWKPYAGNDRSADNSFHDQAAWRRRFTDMERLRLNALVLVHPHPFPLFVDYGAEYPEAAWLSPTQLAAKRNMLRWIVAEGKRHGVSLYFLTWNIWLPRGFAAAHELPQSGVDTPLTRRYTRWTVRRFFETYPGFGGLLTMAAEAPPGCVDFVTAGIVAGLRRVTPRPRLIFWSWCSSPAQARQVLEAYDGPRMALHYLQYEQFFARRADPRIGQFSRDLGGRPMAALGGPKSSHGGLLFAHPRFIYDVLHDLYANNNGRGIVAEGVESPPDRWLAQLAFARYAWSAAAPYDGRLWKSVLAARYGSTSLAGPLLALLESASLVVPDQLKLTHSQSDHFMLQPGLLLAQILAMPTLSTYVFENVQQVDAAGYLTPNLGLSRPNPDWGERVTPVTRWVLSRLPPGPKRETAMTRYRRRQIQLGFRAPELRGDEQTPLDVAAELSRTVRRGRAALARVELARNSATRRRLELQRMIELARVNLALGEYLVCKDRAAAAWETYRLLGRPAARVACLRELEESLRAWRTYSRAFDSFHPGGVTYWTSDLSVPPPCSQSDLWRSYHRMRSRLSARTPLWKRELEVVRQRLSAARGKARIRLTPPTRDELEPLARGRLVMRTDFEKPGDPRYRIVSDACRASLTTDESLTLDGQRSLAADSRASGSEWCVYFETLPQRLQLKPHTTYQIRLRYRALAANDRAPGCFTLALRSATGGAASDVGVARAWTKPTGFTGQRLMTATTRDFDDYYLFLGLHGPAAIVVDDLEIVEVAPRRVGKGLVASVDFERADDPRYELVRCSCRSELTTDKSLVLQGKRSVLVDSRGSDQEWNTAFCLAPEEVPLAPHTRYRLRLRYRVVSVSPRGQFAFFLRSVTGGVGSDVGEGRVWTAPAGAVGEKVVTAVTKGFTDYYAVLSLRGQVALVIDEVRVTAAPSPSP